MTRQVRTWIIGALGAAMIGASVWWAVPAQAGPTQDVTANGVVLTTVDPLPSDSAEPAAPGTVLTQFENLDTGTFSLVALTWSKSASNDVTLYLRTHVASGWSDWTTLSTANDAIEKADGTYTTDAIWVGASDGLQVQAIGGPKSAIADLQAVVIDPGASTPLRPQRSSTASTGFLDAPTIVTRAQWGATTPPCTEEPPDATILGITVHHTAGTNTYTPAEAPGILRGVQAYHVSLGWCDIGYNFLIDQYGTIYEGRAGGMDIPVHGSHATLWNADTVGVSFMMNSDTAQPTAAALAAGERLIAWKLQNYYRDPLGTVVLAGKTLPTIFMHKDVLATACPGQYISARMGEIRQQVAALMAAATPSPIQPKWQELGGAQGTLGQPYRLEQPVGVGRYTEFEGGSVYWSSATGAHAVTGSILTAYVESGGPTGPWGFPLTDVYLNANGQDQQEFQNGWALVPSPGAPAIYQTGTPPAAAPTTVGVTYTAHVASIGWMPAVSNGAVGGTTGRALAMEATTITLQGAPAGSAINYAVHVQDIGWMASVANGQVAGTTGRALRIEAFKIWLTGPIADTYSVWYRAHIASYGWLGFASDGQPAGSQGMALRAEAIQIVLLPRGATPSSTGSTAFVTSGQAPTTPPSPASPSVRYSAHVQNVGWMTDVTNGGIAGTTGRALRMEALKVALTGVSADSHVTVSAHVQNIGWMPAVSDGQVAGTTGPGLRMEAVKITLVGSVATTYDVWYRVHVENYGWLSWASNGAPAGSQGHALRAEAIQILLVPKGGAGPAGTTGPALVE